MWNSPESARAFAPYFDSAPSRLLATPPREGHNGVVGVTLWLQPSRRIAAIIALVVTAWLIVT